LSVAATAVRATCDDVITPPGNLKIMDDSPPLTTPVKELIGSSYCEVSESGAMSTNQHEWQSWNE
jgi:hypothetical protein